MAPTKRKDMAPTKSVGCEEEEDKRIKKIDAIEEREKRIREAKRNLAQCSTSTHPQNAVGQSNDWSLSWHHTSSRWSRKIVVEQQRQSIDCVRQRIIERKLRRFDQLLWITTWTRFKII
jgi:hypothetical protein